MLTGDAGPLAVAAAVQWRLGNKEASSALCLRLLMNYYCMLLLLHFLIYVVTVRATDHVT